MFIFDSGLWHKAGNPSLKVGGEFLIFILPGILSYIIDFTKCSKILKY